MTLYKRVPKDECTKQVGLHCGAREADHPLNMSGYYHEYEGGFVKYVPATPVDIEEAYYEQERPTSED